MKSLIAAAALILAAAPVSAAENYTRMAQAMPACNTILDEAELAELVEQCMQVSPATRPPCNGENSCEMISDEIQRGCAMIPENERPDFCEGFVE